MTRKICVVTGSRADFGLLKWLMQDIKAHPALTLQIVATGAHLTSTFGSTDNEIKESGLQVNEHVDILLASDSQHAVCKSIGLGFIGFADTYKTLQPDIVVVLGDRYEIFSAASAALICGLPIAHLMGGELSEGAIDEAMRHAISKMSHFHFVANAIYRHRVIQLGEQPHTVFSVGGMGVDALHRTSFLSKEELQKHLNITFLSKNLLITYHPVSLDNESPGVQMQALFSALSQLENTLLIFTFPNADAGHSEIIHALKSYTDKHSHAVFFPSLGQKPYLSMLRCVDAVVGNSSSGLAEAPSFDIPTVNIGKRQNGRLKAESVLDCPMDTAAVVHTINACYQAETIARVKRSTNPYGEKGASRKIAEALVHLPLNHSRQKKFFDISFVEGEEIT